MWKPHCGITWKRVSRPKPKKESQPSSKSVRRTGHEASGSPARSHPCPSSPFHGEPSEPADTIFLNGNVYTVNDAATAGRSDCHQRRPHSFRRLERRGEEIFRSGHAHDRSQGKTVVPGLTDSHYHILGVGERLTHLNLESATSLRNVSRQGQRGGRGGRPGPMDHRPRLDRDLLEAAGFSDPRGAGQSRAGQSGLSRAGRRPRRGRQQQGAEDCRDRGEDARSIRRRNLARQENRRTDSACYSTTRWSWSRRKSRRPHRRKTRELFCSARNARSLSAGARSKTPEAICPRWS